MHLHNTNRIGADKLMNANLDLHFQSQLRFLNCCADVLTDVTLTFCDLNHNQGVILQSEKASYPKLGEGMVNRERIVQKKSLTSYEGFFVTELKERFVIVWGDE